MGGMILSAGLSARWPGWAVLALLILVSAMRDMRPLRIALAIVALVWLTAAARSQAWLGALAAGLLLALNLLQLWLLGAGDRGVRFSVEEELLVAGAFGRMRRRDARQLLDHGIWINGKAGEVLTREGEPVTHLFYLAEGSASVFDAGRRIATAAGGSLIGEMTVLSGEPATGTVTLETASRFWCIGADALRRLLSADPALRAPLENSFAGSLRDKLVLSNRRFAEEEGAAPETIRDGEGRAPRGVG